MEGTLSRLVTYHRGIGSIVREDSDKMVAEQDSCRVS